MKFTPEELSNLVDSMEEAAKKEEGIGAFILLALHAGSGINDEDDIGSATTGMCGTGGDIAALLCNFYCNHPEMFWLPLAFMVKSRLIPDGAGMDKYKEAVGKVFKDTEADILIEAVALFSQRCKAKEGVIGNA